MSRIIGVAIGVLAVVAALGVGRSADATDYTVGLGAGVAPDYDGSDDYNTYAPCGSSIHGFESDC